MMLKRFVEENGMFVESSGDLAEEDARGVKLSLEISVKGVVATERKNQCITHK